MAKKVVINRSSVTGRIVTAAYAKTHPATTEKQHVTKPSGGGRGGKKR
jgi:hypothetical protein